jgi:hypothetical protein
MKNRNRIILPNKVANTLVHKSVLFDEDGEWCEKKTLGKNTLAIIMTNISRKAYLSKHDTNHCVRATCITVLREACFEARQIVTACLFYCF